MHREHDLEQRVVGLCERLRPCTFATSEEPICRRCAPRRTATCARCGHDRPPAVRWNEGPLCDPCYTAALRHRGRCAVYGHERRLVAPPGPEATTCTDCTGMPITHACGDCGLEDKLYEKGHCARCSLRRRATALLSGRTGTVPTELTAVFEAIYAARTPRSALNWLRKSTGRRHPCRRSPNGHTHRGQRDMQIDPVPHSGQYPGRAA